ncbi:phosphate ABC transporter permease PstA [Acidaminobacter hydrogenoformans]|uniref:Phosphate transport system permease protein PstA n=1 Tax=Acidaminobacter hydrogenoformans DSM 2784 TaxID=1120920 RepID=A0A1G5S0V8_9FIRM|nr:phosphate ABC transporter permease PstA [Acidaminobacter hydrogenoformans]SCZ79994.1 phosphate ABC transporter membrane protein 2, PhoT family (TC 3.A.1.7.1) [Acidaminobacter hydrogenoformans DSM 2784]
MRGLNVNLLSEGRGESMLEIEQASVAERYKVKIDSSRIERRVRLNNGLKHLFSLSTVFALVVLAILLYRIGVQSMGWLDLQFLTSNLSRFAEKAGIYGAILGTVYLMLIVVPVTLVLGVSTAIYLEEYATKGRIQRFIKVNISNLASVPSVIFGLLGLAVFGRMFNLGSSILAGGLTMSLLVLPTVVVASQEAIKAVPGFLREASYGMGADKWTTIRKVVLPVALPGILTGSILAMSRAIGETAPLVVLGIPTLILKVPNSLLDDFTALPIQIYYWTLDTVLTPEYANLAAATIVVLLAVLFVLNSVAIIIRNKFQKRF